jgi:uncharacterized membrane protein
VTRVLLAGESWTTTSVHVKGFDSFTTVEYAEGGGALIDALERAGHDVTFMPNHVAATAFPFTLEQLDAFDVVLLSDIGANTLLIPPETFSRGEIRPNRLEALRDWVLKGGGLGMIGGYLSFQGIEAKANYRNSPLAGVLPVEMELGDDREETPEGARPVVRGSHPLTVGLDADWPPLLGFQRVVARLDARVLAEVKGHPLLVVGQAGLGRTVAYTTDIGPHWAPSDFTDWPGFGLLWDRAVRYLAGEDL